MSKKTTTRIKKKVINDVTRDQAVQAFADLSAADAKVKKMQAELDLKFTEIREKYQDKFEENTEIIADRTEILQEFLKQHPEVLGKKRSVELTHGTIGYRKATPSLKTLKGFTWESCKNLVKVMLGGAKLGEYYRAPEAIDKEKLLADRELPLTDILTYKEDDPIFQIEQDKRPKLESLFENLGIKVSQEETFYVEPKKEEAILA